MVPNTKKLIEAFIGGLPRSIEGNVIASKPQTLEEAINITQRLMDQVPRHNMCKEPMIINESLMIEEPLTTTTTKTTVTTTMTIMITTNNKIEGMKPSGPMLLPQLKIVGSFDVIISMDWLSKYHARIICDEKVIHILIDGKTLNHLSSSNGKEVIRKTTRRHTSSQEIFLENLLGLPPIRQIEFQINLIPGATPVARAPYRLSPLEMQELLNQLQELVDRGYHLLRVRNEDIPKTAFRT
ncbi:hypothetical protein Tco_0566072, partial [Tanacetum coccineum]